MKVAISACLVGQKCRYNGKDKFNEDVISRFAKDEITLFCPEDAIFGTPREPISIIDSKLMQNEKEFTKDIAQEAYKLVEVNPQIVVLKSKSPSCGLRSVKYFNQKKEIISETGIGVFAKVLVHNLVDTKFYEESEL